MSFREPLLLLALALLPLAIAAYVLAQRRRKKFALRYTNVDAFRRGEDLGIVELNGVTSESTNIYDPDYGAVRAWRTLARQWQLVFEIGHANRARGAPALNLRRLLKLTLVYWRSAPAMPVAS